MLSVVRVKASQAEASFSNETHHSRSKKEKKMKTTNKTTDMKDRKAMLSILWIFVMFNFTYIEIACLLFIVWYAWTWRQPEGAVLTSGQSSS